MGFDSQHGHNHWHFEQFARYQYVAGQSFDITNVPNGTYYIEVIANPERVLYESNTSNDSSLRKVILGGTPGHRTVKVPAWHGIDPEN